MACLPNTTGILVMHLSYVHYRWGKCKKTATYCQQTFFIEISRHACQKPLGLFFNMSKLCYRFAQCRKRASVKKSCLFSSPGMTVIHCRIRRSKTCHLYTTSVNCSCQLKFFYWVFLTSLVILLIFVYRCCCHDIASKCTFYYLFETVFSSSNSFWNQWRLSNWRRFLYPICTVYNTIDP